MGKHKITVAQMMKKLQKNQHFEISLIPKDYLLEEKNAGLFRSIGRRQP